MNPFEILSVTCLSVVRKPQPSAKASPRTPSSRTGKSKQTTAAAIAASAHLSHYSDPTSYLIDKMFAGSSGSGHSDVGSDNRSESPASPEHAMYQEAVEYDKAGQRGGLTYRVNQKSPHQTLKQKSSSRSPESKTAATKATEKLSERKTLEQKLPDKQAPKTLQVLPKQTTDGDNEDQLSEAGTYTIEADKDGEEEMKARQLIDEVFGVEIENFSFERPVIGSLEELHSSDEGERTIHEDENMECLTPPEEVSCQSFEDEVRTILLSLALLFLWLHYSSYNNISFILLQFYVVHHFVFPVITEVLCSIFALSFL